MPDKTGAMILSTLMMLAVASALSASTPQRNLSSCCSCHGTTQGVRRTHQGSRRAHGVGPGHGCSGPTSIPEPLNTCAGRLTVSNSISSKEGVCCGGAFRIRKCCCLSVFVSTLCTSLASPGKYGLAC
jgi:hypothetical protein